MGRPTDYKKESCDPSVALTKFEYFVAFEKKEQEVSGHSEGAFINTNPEYHLKFETLSTENYHDEYLRFRQRRVRLTGEA